MFNETEGPILNVAGFCKNDKNHDVYLLVEAFSLPDNDEDMGKKVGEGKVAIYPRTNAPRPNHAASPGDDIYRYDDVVSLLRTAQVTTRQKLCRCSAACEGVSVCVCVCVRACVRVCVRQKVLNN